MNKTYLEFNGKAVVRALGKELKAGFREEVSPEVAKHFDDPRARALGFKVRRVKEEKKSDNKVIEFKENNKGEKKK